MPRPAPSGDQLPLQQAVIDGRRLLTVPWVGFLQRLLALATSKVYVEGTHLDRVGDGTPAHPGTPAGQPGSKNGPGTFFYETDRGVLYQSRMVIDPGAPTGPLVPAWVYVSGTMRDTLANKPTDLGWKATNKTVDTGFLFYATDYAHTWQWTAFSYTDLVIGATNTDLTSAANPFTAADVGSVIHITIGTGFTLGSYEVISVAGSTATMDRAVGTALSTAGKGFRMEWDFAPGDRFSGEIAWFALPLGTGWALCDGSSTTMTTPSATVITVDTPNLIGAYAKGATGYTGAVIPASGSLAGGTTDPESGHTHAIDHDHPAFSSGNAGPVTSTFAGGPFNGTDPPHTHTIDVPPYAGTSGAGSAHTHTLGSMPVTAEPKHVELMPYLRQ